LVKENGAAVRPVEVSRQPSVKPLAGKDPELELRR